MNGILMAKFNVVTRQVYCLVLMAGIFSLHLALSFMGLSMLGVPPLAIFAMCVFPLSIIFWHLSRNVVIRMLRFLEEH